MLTGRLREGLEFCSRTPSQRTTTLRRSRRPLSLGKVGRSKRRAMYPSLARALP